MHTKNTDSKNAILMIKENEKKERSKRNTDTVMLYCLQQLTHLNN